MEMINCTQGQLNKKDIENIKVISASQSQDIKDIKECLHRLEVQVVTMNAMLSESIRENHACKVELKEHLADSRTRIDDIKLNTVFRKVGCWLFGIIISTALISGIHRLIGG